MTDPANAPDWAAIELDYRSGVKPLRLIAEQHGISHTAIQKRAKRDGWSRDLSGKIKAREDELVAKALVAKTVAKETMATKKRSEDRQVEQMAFTKATVRIDHAAKIRRGMSLFMAMLGDLEVTSNPEGQGLIESLMDAVKQPDDETPEEAKKRRLRQSELLAKILGIPGRIESGKRLVDMLDRLVAMERQAYGILDKDPVEDQAGKVLGDTERASRAAFLFAQAMARQKAAQAENPTPADAA